MVIDILDKIWKRIPQLAVIGAFVFLSVWITIVIKDYSYRFEATEKLSYDMATNQLPEIRRRLHEIEHRLDKVEKRLDIVEQRLDNLEKRMDKLEQRMERVESILLKMDAYFSATDERYRRMKTTSP